MAANGLRKELYMAQSMEELNKKMNVANIDCSTPRLLGKSSNALYLAAKDAALQKDEEKAYVLFMRFMELVKKIRSSKEYKNRRAEYDKMVPTQKIRAALSEAERLSESLRERYAGPQGKRQKLDAEEPEGEGVTDQQVPNDATESNKPLSAEDLYKRNLNSALVPQQTETRSQTENTDSTTITAQDLFALLKSSPDDVIVLDCRPRSMFLASHPDGKKYPQWLSVPEEMIKQGVTSDAIEKFLRGNGRKMWRQRASKQAIVLVDGATTSAELSLADTAGLPLSQLRDAIHKYDTSVELPRPPVYLEGGYTQWYLHYSPVCVGVWKWEGRGGRGEEGRGGEGGKGESLTNGSEGSFDYPSFPEISGDEVGVAQAQSDETTPTLPPVTPVATEEAVLVPDTSSGHTPFSQAQPTQVVPSAPSPHITAPTLTNHTPFPHPSPQTVPTAVYEPPPVMTILSLDDPNLNQDDPVVDLSTMPEKQADQFNNGLMQHQRSTIAPHAQYPDHHLVAHPISQPVQPQFIMGQEAVSQAQMNTLMHLQMEQQFRTDQNLGQPIANSQGHAGHQPMPLHVLQGAHHPQTGQAYPQPSQMHPQIAQPAPMHPQAGQGHPPNTQPAFQHPQSGQPTQLVDPQTGYPPHPQIGHPQQQPVHTGLPHPQIVQPSPQLEQPLVQPGQTFPPHTQSQVSPNLVQGPESIPNQRVAQGSIPNPPGYVQALQLPSQPVIPSPIPPPVSLGQNQSNQLQNQSGQYQNQSNQFVDQVGQFLTQPDQFHHGQQLGQHPIQDGQVYNPAVHYQTGQPHPPSAQYRNQVRPVENQLQNPDQPAHSQHPPNAHVHIDPTAAKIQELERQLHEKEEGEKARREMEEKAKAKLEQEKQEWQQERAREMQKVEQEKLALVQAKAAMKEELEKMRLQVENEREKSIKESEQLRQMLKLQQSGQKNQRTFAVNQGLPAGWEKRLDRTTGRFYYIDHSSKTTHWNPPANWLDYQAQLQQQQLREQQALQKPGGPGQFSGQAPQHHGGPGQYSGQTPQHHGVPGQISHPPSQQQPAANTGGRITHNSAQPARIPATQISNHPPQAPQQHLPPMSRVAGTSPQSHTQTGQPIVKQVTPSVDRSNKPQTPSVATPSVDRSTKPMMNVAQYKKKVSNLQPMFGSQGYGLTGLRNLGNTCFMNSTLQCLCATTPFVSHFLRGGYLKDRNRSNPLGHGGALAEEFSFLMKAMWSGQYRFLSPRDFKDTVSKFAPMFSGSQQHDSQEFLAFLMDGLHEDMNRVVERRYIENPDYSKFEDRKAASVAWSLHKKRNDSIIVDLFQGQFRSTLRCLTCQHRSVNFEAFMYLSVPLPPGNTPCSLKETIRLFTKEEHVSGSDKWYCSTCHQHRDASKRIEIWKLPPILLIHLKRFSYDGVWRQKKQNFVDFPFTGLDMSSDVVGARDGLQNYQLFGVSNHYGTLTGGHYTAFSLNPYKQRFYNFDDHEIKEVSHKQVKSSAAYLLFYSCMDLSPPKMF